MVPAIRIHALNASPPQSSGEYILYWMIAYRRLRYNFALERALEWVEDLRKPLLILEPLRCAYPWANDRLHHFLLEGMVQNVQETLRSGTLYLPYLEPRPDAGKGLLAAVARKACVVVTDEFPCFMYPQMTAAAARQLDVRLERVDSNGLLPLRCSDHAFPTAYSFRRFVQKTLPDHLASFPQAKPLQGRRVPVLRSPPAEIGKRWRPVTLSSPTAIEKIVAQLPLDHSVSKALFEGGSKAARRTLQDFLRNRLAQYASERNQPEMDISSGLSPYLHFGHISSHEIFEELMRQQDWSVDSMDNTKPTGKRRGWWKGLSESAEEFLDQLITWRELGFNFCFHRKDYDQFESLPGWAEKTLKKHARDRRPHVYTLDELRMGETQDPLWNAAQGQLVSEGRLHNYLRMLWGKKILEWSRTPQEALAAMIELNNQYALDGRDPNSYSGIFWVLGRYDRPWGPERPIFGTVRYMSSENTARKVRVREYIKKYASATHL